MNKMTRFLAQFDQYLISTLRRLTLACFVTLLILLSGVVFVRFVPVTSLGWSDEIVEWAFAWMVFMGAAVLWRDNEHFRVAWLPNRLKGTGSGKLLGLTVEILSMAFLAIMTYYGVKLAVAAHDRSPILELPRHIWYLCIPVAGIIMIAYSIRTLIGHVLEIRPLGFTGTSMKTTPRNHPGKSSHKADKEQD